MKYHPERFSPKEMLKRSQDFLEKMETRRSVRHFSSDEVPMDAVVNCIAAAGTAPSGAHKQPWTFCLVTDPEIRKRIRFAAEEEEYRNYNGRMSPEWMKDLEPFGTNEIKPFIENAPGLIVVFKHSYGTDESGKTQNYYVNESVGIAVGMLLTALHEIGLVALTHTPSPMKFLAEILERPENERAYLNIPFGFPSDNCEVPNLKRKPISDILIKYS
ncbi:MAG: nitroreductase family protein [Bacteroidetes bacterium]|jgi:iodotyrosine deiodinase|nr:nitroreductase family protein [Bacteroidota bacterium]MDA1382310.1 nitroreductase family protein [Bacteroidota bacterium]